MWCRRCQQDVAGVASGASAELACSRCANILSHVQDQPAVVETADNKPEAPQIRQRHQPSPFEQVDWELEQELRTAERLLRSLGVARIDGPHGQSRDHEKRTDPAPHFALRYDEHRALPEPAFTSRMPKKKLWSFAAWLLIALGITVGVFGCALLLISRLTNRHELWGTGISFGVAGQVLLIFGMFLQQEALQQAQQETNETIALLERQIQEQRFRAETLPESSLYRNRSAEV